MTTFYFAARYSRNEELRGYRDQLEAAWPDGQVKVTSRWIDQHGGNLPGSFDPEALNSDPDGCWKYGLADIEDLTNADVIVSFTGGGGKGGRHVEHGWAMGYFHQFGSPRIVIVGPRENIFHCAPGTEVHPDWAAFLAAEEARYLPPGQTRSHPFRNDGAGCCQTCEGVYDDHVVGSELAGRVLGTHGSTGALILDVD